MQRSARKTATYLAMLFLGCLVTPLQVQEYTLDAAHTAVTFQISHLGLSWTHGRFSEVGGDFTINTEAPEETTFVSSQAKS